jgi:hypothetical protein
VLPPIGVDLFEHHVEAVDTSVGRVEVVGPLGLAHAFRVRFEHADLVGESAGAFLELVEDLAPAIVV